MNTVLLITEKNIEELELFSTELAERQKQPVTGKLLIIASYYLDEERIKTITRNLNHLFEVSEVSSVQNSQSQSFDVQIATMVATFLIQRYTSVPGPWIIIDQRCEITVDNPLALIEKVHTANSQDNSGRASNQDGGRVPIGPVIVGAPVSKMGSLRTVSGESWRSRGRWAFSSTSWYQMTPDEYPFRSFSSEISSDEVGVHAPAYGAIETKSFTSNKKESLPAPKKEEKKESGGVSKAGIQTIDLDEEPESNKTAQEAFYENESSKSVAPVAGEAGFVPPSFEPPSVSKSPASDDTPIVETDETRALAKSINPERPKPFMRMDATYYKKATKAELMEQIAHRGKKKAHPASKVGLLIKKLQAIDEIELTQ